MPKKVNGRTEPLRSWKAIAAFFGNDERTVRRWEERGLPVRRIPGGGRASIYAEVADLEQWLKGNAPAPGAHQPTVGHSLSRRARAFILAGGCALVVTAAAGLQLWSAQGSWHQTNASRLQPPGKAVELYLTATYNLERRTPQSLERARDLFGRAIAEDPDYAAAYSGLASTYLLLREFSAMPEPQAYARAHAAAERALSLDPKLAAAHAALGFVTFYSMHDWTGGLQSMERAIALDPTSAVARHWYATALAHAARFPESLAAIDEAQRLDQSSRSILADKAIILFHAGRTEQGLTILREMEANDPDFYSPHAYTALIYLAQNNFRAFVDELAMAAKIKHDPDKLAIARVAEQGLRAGGGEAMLRAILGEQMRQHRAGSCTDYTIAETYSELGMRERALVMLQSSYRRGEGDIVALRVEPAFQNLHGDPRFQRLAARIGEPSPHPDVENFPDPAGSLQARRS